MLPSLVARNVIEGIKSYLKTTFPPATPAFRNTLEAFLDEPGRVFKGPYYELRLPFRPAPTQHLPFETISFPWRPHLHQAAAFERLCGDHPRSTLIATGTGSGKTECFLYPILDYCAARAGMPGIKAIVIYPMNALATDQARRIAQAIYRDEPNLRGRVTAGLFIGEESTPCVQMSETDVITQKDHLRAHPPDILLTNYRMLDFLLLRPSDQDLWRHNVPETLRFLVVDEIHTFDGAQSTDLACLIRRLKSRLNTPAGHLCCIGTSATLGSAQHARSVIHYAQTVFAEPFSDGCIIGEDVMRLEEVTADSFIRYHALPDPDSPLLLPCASGGNLCAYLTHQYRLWFGETPPMPLDEDAGRVMLGQRLCEHSFFRNFFVLVERSGRRQLAEDRLMHELGLLDRTLSDPARIRRILDSFLSLCVHARKRVSDGGMIVPLVRLHVHVWMREMARMVATVEESPQLHFSDDLQREAKARQALPVIHCRDCGTMGWGGTLRVNDQQVSSDPQAFYSAFFKRRTTLRLIFPEQGRHDSDLLETGMTHRLCGHCLTIHSLEAMTCPKCMAEDRQIAVRIENRVRQGNGTAHSEVVCPFCGGTNSLTVMGLRSATLTSVALSQVYASSVNTDKKALAFSDNVQDASHIAGFVSARTWKMNLRTAICRVIPETGKVMTLPELETEFVRYWRSRLGDIDFVGCFLAPTMEWLPEFEALKQDGRLPGGGQLLDLISRRMAWEITAEFGFNSRIGRTLEKSGVAVAAVDPDRMVQAASMFCERIRENAGGFGHMTEQMAQVFLAGLVYRVRTIGGMMHPELASYVESGGNTFLLHRQIHMPKFGSGRAPAFFYLGTGRMPRFEKLVAGGTSVSWSQRWASKTLIPSDRLFYESTAIALEEAVRVLSEVGIFFERIVQGSRVWGLLREPLLIQADVRQMTCTQCGHHLSCSEPEAAIWMNAPCQRVHCSGTYQTRVDTDNYYRDLYRQGEVVRIRPAEHTGLLTRPDREDIENRFMRQPPNRRTTDPNLLSCTPTLEMGVDIGDLSTVCLCSVPPGVSQYVQRVGRAGRKTGAGLNLTIATAVPHDLYFYQLPEDMIAGDIDPPGTFLNAPAVLERQFTAFCMDQWSALTHPRPIIPRKIQGVLDIVRTGEHPDRFPYNLLHFIQMHIDKLLSGFLELFGPEELTAASRSELERFAKGDDPLEQSLTRNTLTRLAALARDREALRNRLQQIGSAIRRNKAQSARDDALESELLELQQYRNGMYGMINAINNRLVLNFFTDEGLLPNYAFPEAGVTLQSIILKEPVRSDDQARRYEAVPYEYIRPAASAIFELAPGNVFYVQGRRVRIDQIGMAASDVESWHFCDNCSYMERVTEQTAQRLSCPACASPNWPDRSLTRDLIRIAQVISTTVDRKSRSHDEKEERELEFFSRHESVVIPQTAERRAYQIRGGQMAFGYEFISKSTLRVVNMGQTTEQTPCIRIGGRDVPAAGFSICPECGKVQLQSTDGEPEALRHDISCRNRNRHASQGAGGNTAPLRAVFLYRELSSEAIRMLLPVSYADARIGMNAFAAAVHLGLKCFFHGNIDHLKGCMDDVPVPGSTIRRHYLMLYDQVPGGTGYLKQLADPASLLSVLRMALDHLERCDCANRPDHDTDGCHRCILQFRHRRDRHPLSRRTAIHLLRAVLEHADELEPVDSLSDIDLHPQIQSELERLFLESLKTEPGALLQPRVVHGRPGYRWQYQDAVWEVALQVPISTDRMGGQASNAAGALNSIPDFVFYPVRPAVSRPIAVFLDGFAFHADERAGHNRIAQDVAQQQVLVHCGRYWVWRFSWDDISLRHSPERIAATRFGQANRVRRVQMAAQLGDSRTEIVAAPMDAPAWQLFLKYLTHPLETEWTRMAWLDALTLPNRLGPVSLEAVGDILNQLQQTDTPLRDIPNCTSPDGFGGVFSEGGQAVQGIAASTKTGIHERNPSGLFLLLCFNDDRHLTDPDFALHWQGLLHLMNRLQFLPNCHMTTIRACRDGWLPDGKDAFAGFLSGGDQLVAAEFEESDPAIRPVLERFASEDREKPVIGYELFAHGRILATAEAAWPSRQVCLMHRDMPEDRNLFVQSGWQVFLFDDSGLSAVDLETLTSIIPVQR